MAFSLHSRSILLAAFAVPFGINCQAKRCGTNSAAVVNLTAIYSRFLLIPVSVGIELIWVNLRQRFRLRNSHLPAHIQEVDIPDDAKVCACCGLSLEGLGQHEDSEQIEIETVTWRRHGRVCA